MSCSCEFVSGTFGDEPKSRETLEEVAHESYGVAWRTRYKCKQCGAKLEYLEEDRGPRKWERIP